MPENNCFVLDKKSADEVSFAICEVFHKKEIPVGYVFKKDPPVFCGLISEVLDYEETDKEALIKLRVRKLKGKEMPNPVGYSVIISKIIKEV